MGEVALSGAIRPVSQPARRLAELARLGFTRAIVPKGTSGAEGIAVIPANTLRDALSAAGLHGRKSSLLDEVPAGD
jgi:DNA repair protein RadA/Sms